MIQKIVKKMNLIYFKVLYVHDLPWTYSQIGSKWVDTLMNHQTWQPYHEIINIKFAIHAIFTKTHISPTVPRVQRVSKLLAFFQNATPSLSRSLSLTLGTRSFHYFIHSERAQLFALLSLSLSHSLTIPYVFPQSLILHVRATTSRSDASFALLRALTN